MLIPMVLLGNLLQLVLETKRLKVKGKEMSLPVKCVRKPQQLSVCLVGQSLPMSGHSKTPGSGKMLRYF